MNDEKDITTLARRSVQIEMPPHLEAHVSEGRTLLVLVDGEHYMATQEAAYKPKCKDGVSTFCVADLCKQWSSLVELAKGRTTFTRTELGIVASVTQTTLTSWMNAGILPIGTEPRGIARTFPFIDLFTSALAGSLRRQNVPFAAVVKACRFIRLGVMETAAR